MAMVCHRCGKANDPEDRFCGRCGFELEDAPAPVATPAPEDERFCYRHRREKTLLSCGKCGKPVCHRCAILGPAGTRCPECGKQQIPFKPRAVLADIRMSLRRVASSGPWSIWMWVVILGMVFSFSRGCIGALQPRSQPPVERMQMESEDGFDGSR